MAFKSMYAPFALLEVDWIARQVPVVIAVAVWMEVEPSCPMDVVARTKAGTAN